MSLDKKDKEYLEETFTKKDEFLELKTVVYEVKEIVKRIDKRDKEDSNLFSSIFLSHDQRISRLEKLAKKELSLFDFPTS